MKVETTRRYNSKKKASYEVRVWLTDWECSMTISALKHYTKTYQLPKGTKGFVEKHLKAGFSKALGTVLKAEFNDINKNNNIKPKTVDLALEILSGKQQTLNSNLISG